MNPAPLRLIDLHVDWLLQYAQESTVFDPALYSGVESRLGQAEGYLGGARVAVLASFRRAEDWAQHAEPWTALGTLLTRYEAEFAGRLLMGPDDLARCLDDPDGLCWGLLGVEGFDALVRTAADLDRLPGLFERGVRLFQPVYSGSSLLGGSSSPGDDRGLTDLGRAFLGALADLGGTTGPRPAVDLAHLHPRAAGEVLDWLETDTTRAARVIPVYSHGALRHDGFDAPRAMTSENLGRLRALGGVIGFSVGPPFYPTADSLKAGIEAAAALPFRGCPGFDGIGIGTDFLGVDQTLPGLGNVADVAAWVAANFDPPTALALLQGNALDLLRRIVSP